MKATIRLKGILCLTLVLTLAHNVRAQTQVDVRIDKLVRSTCSQINPNKPVTSGKAIAGSLALVNVNVHPVSSSKQTASYPTEKPLWLSLEFAYDTDGKTFESDQEIARACAPEYFLNKDQWQRNTELSISDPLGHNGKSYSCNFVISIPEEAAGQKLCARAVVSYPVYGGVVKTNYPDGMNFSSLSVVAPCSEEDEYRISASQILYLDYTGNYEQVVTLADSLVATGWHDESALLSAYHAARGTRNFNSALRFLDLLYHTYGYFGFSRSNVSQQFETKSANELRADSLYDVLRESILREIEEQQ